MMNKNTSTAIGPTDSDRCAHCKESLFTFVLRTFCFAFEARVCAGRNRLPSRLLGQIAACLLLCGPARAVPRLYPDGDLFSQSNAGTERGAIRSSPLLCTAAASVCVGVVLCCGFVQHCY